MGYFIHSHARTIKGLKIIALGIIILSSTGLLVNSFGNEIVEITTLLGESNDAIVITPAKNSVFSATELELLENLIQSRKSVMKSIFEYTSLAEFDIYGETMLLPVHITNMTNLLKIVNIEINTSSNKSMGLITSEMTNYEVGDIIVLKSLDILKSEVNYLLEIQGKIPSLNPPIKMINSGVYFDDLQFDLEEKNMIQIQFEGGKKDMKFVDILEEYSFLTISDARPEASFLMVSTNQVVVLLLLLQTMISFLVILNIWNLFIQLLYESKFDIRVLLSVGYDKWDVRFIFFAIACIMGILSFLLSTIISYLLVNIILIILSLITDGSKLDIFITGKILLFNAMNSIFISILGSIYPIYREVRM